MNTGNREEDAPTSAWRMLMVANEFAELQTMRVTYPPFTLLFFVSTIPTTAMWWCNLPALMSAPCATYKTQPTNAQHMLPGLDLGGRECSGFW